MAPDKGWQRRFDDPVPLPHGGTHNNLREAGEYVAKLPKAKQDRPEWHLEAEMLMEAAEDGMPVMCAHIAMLKALNAGKPDRPEPRRKRAKAYKVIR
jgi:hypothetical protein